MSEPADHLADELDRALSSWRQGDPGLLQSMMGDVDEDDQLLEALAAAPIENAVFPPAAIDVRGFEIVREIGRGASSIVFEASTNGSAVALKILRDLVHSDAFHRRLFQREIDAMRSIDHPGVVRIIDSGTTGQGHCYIATELITGARLDDFAQQHRADPDSLLDCFIAICDGVEAAHQKGVVHRDLKPANIIVRDSGEPCILDFGLARIAAEHTSQTRSLLGPGRLLGTLPYLSPERITQAGHHVDTRSDVYALGVILFEMIAGHHPIRTEHLGIPAAVEAIAHQAPTALSRVAPQISRDLEIVVARSLEKDVARRFQSVAALREEVRRVRIGEPIRTRPPGMLRLLWRFALAHRVAASFAFILIALVTGFGAVVTWQAISLAQQRDQIQSELDRANIEAEKAIAVQAFMSTVFAAADPSHGRRDLTVREAIDGAMVQFGADGDVHPRVRAATRIAIADLLTGLGAYHDATPLFEEAVEILDGLPRTDDCEYAIALRYLAGNRFDTGDFDGATAVLEQALTAFEAAAAPPRAAYARALNDRGIIHQTRGQLPEAETDYQRAYELRLSAFGPTHDDVAQSRHNLAAVLIEAGRYDEAEPHIEASVRHRMATAPNATPTIQAINTLAQLSLLKGDPVRATTVLAPNLERCLQSLGPDHPVTTLTRHHLAVAHMDDGRPADAAASLRVVIDAWCEQLGASHPFVAVAQLNLARCLLHLDRPDESRAQLQIARRVLDAEYPPDHPRRQEARHLAERLAAVGHAP